EEAVEVEAAGALGAHAGEEAVHHHRLATPRPAVQVEAPMPLARPAVAVEQGGERVAHRHLGRIENHRVGTHCHLLVLYSCRGPADGRPAKVTMSTDRRSQIVRGAIDLIATRGIRALTHRAVDTHLELPPGSTSYCFRTRNALIEAVADGITA